MHQDSDTLPPRQSRRTFVKQSSLLAGGMLAAPAFLRSQMSDPRMNRPNIACIGVGGKGRSDTAEAAKYGNIVALCDVDFHERRAVPSVREHPKAARFTDWRKLLDKMANEIDAVTISTPDHSHFPIAMAALELGKHVCVQKPLTNSIWEARQLMLAARNAGVVTQMGIQGHTYEGIRLLKEWTEAGAIGKPKQVRYWTNRPIWPQSADVVWQTADRVPPEINWDVWRGTVAREQPYTPDLHPKRWRASWDYGCGALGDIGCHLFDAAFWAWDLGIPDEVVCEASTPFTEAIAPSHSMVRYTFTKNNRGEPIEPVEFLWSDGNLRPPIPEGLGANTQLDAEFGQLIYGSDGQIYSPGGYCQTLRLFPEEDMRAFERPPRKYPRVKGGSPIKEWVEAIQANTQPGADFEYSARLTEVVLLGNLAIRLGQPIKWDSENLQVIGHPEAAAMIKREYRSGWEPKELKA